MSTFDMRRNRSHSDDGPRVTPNHRRAFLRPYSSLPPLALETQGTSSDAHSIHSQLPIPSRPLTDSPTFGRGSEGNAYDEGSDPALASPEANSSSCPGLGAWARGQSKRLTIEAIYYGSEMPQGVVDGWLPAVVSGFTDVLFGYVPPSDPADEHVVGFCVAGLDATRFEFAPNVTYMTAGVISMRFLAWLKRSGLGDPHMWDVRVVLVK